MDEIGVASCIEIKKRLAVKEIGEQINVMALTME